jgi:hypothetical protein
MAYIGDSYTLTAKDGEIFYFPDDTNGTNPTRLFLATGGFGAPPVEWETKAGYKQDGATVNGYKIGVRTITATWYEDVALGCTRAEYWEKRGNIQAFLRPDRAPFTFTLVQPNGIKRALQVYPQQGWIFPELSNEEDAFTIRETIPLLAFDPIWYDPQVTSVVGTNVENAQLVYPFSYGVNNGRIYGVFKTSTAAINYTGTWDAYPTLTLTGPYTNVNITLNGARITLETAIVAGETRTITTQQGKISVVDGLGNNKISELSTTSNIIDFKLLPPPIQTGQNVVSAVFEGSTLTTAIQIQFNTRYWAL